jgi:hypothetical protein
MFHMNLCGDDVKTIPGERRQHRLVLFCRAERVARAQLQRRHLHHDLLVQDYRCVCSLHGHQSDALCDEHLKTAVALLPLGAIRCLHFFCEATDLTGQSTFKTIYICSFLSAVFTVS